MEFPALEYPSAISYNIFTSGEDGDKSGGEEKTLKVYVGTSKMFDKEMKEEVSHSP